MKDFLKILINIFIITEIILFLYWDMDYFIWFNIIAFFPLIVILWLFFSTIKNHYKKYQKVFMIDKEYVYYFIK